MKQKSSFSDIKRTTKWLREVFAETSTMKKK